MPHTAETIHLTYRELAQRFGIEISGARSKAIRHVRAGRWRLIPANRPGGIVLVEVPVAELPAAPPPPPAARTAAEVRVLESASSMDQSVELVGFLRQAQTDLTVVTAERDSLRGELDRAQTDLRQAQTDLAVVTAERDILREELERARTGWEVERDKRAELTTALTVLLDRVDREDAGRRAEVARLREELAAAQHRTARAEEGAEGERSSARRAAADAKDLAERIAALGREHMQWQREHAEQLEILDREHSAHTEALTREHAAHMGNLTRESRDKFDAQAAVHKKHVNSLLADHAVAVERASWRWWRRWA